VNGIVKNGIYESCAILANNWIVF